MIVSFHKGFILARTLLKALREYLSNRKCNLKIGNNELTPNIFANADTLIEKKILGESEFEADAGLRFIPPVYIQRYLAVQDVLADDKWEGNLKKVVDFGCAEFGFFTYLKHISGVEEILTVDIDKELLKNHQCRVAPLMSDYLSTRSHPLTVQAFVGSIAKLDKCLLDTDAVVCIEIIEHLWPEEVESVPYTVFGFIKPKVAVFTTPNSDFNILFPNFSGFRHFDHKFEWSREQFQCWAYNIMARYPDYEVTIDGIGRGPEGTEEYGHCSQMAVFTKRTLGTKYSTEDDFIDQPFELLFEYKYPFRKDNRTDNEKICHEAEYYIRSYGTADRYCNDQGVIEIPISHLMPLVSKWCNSQALLISILKENNWEISMEDTENVAVVYPWYDGHSDSLSSEGQDEANDTSATILPDDAADDWCLGDEWDIDEVVPTSSSSVPNGTDLTTNTPSTLSQEICVCDMDEQASSLSVNDSRVSLVSDASKSNHLHNPNSIILPVTEEIILTKGVRDFLLTSPQVFQAKEKSPSSVTYPNGELPGYALNGQALGWKHVTANELADGDDHETPSVSGEWGMSSPELFSCDSITSQEGTSSFCSAISHDASEPESDLDMDLSIERDAVDSEDSDGSQEAPLIDNPRRVQQHRGHFPFGLNAVVENGDVANNNQDGEGNNAIAFVGEEEDRNFQLFEEEAGDHEVAAGFDGNDDLEDEDDILLPNDADPFPPWLLQMLHLTNEVEEMGGAGEPQWIVNNG